MGDAWDRRLMKRPPAARSERQMSPQWKFRDGTGTHADSRPFYEQPWPADLPESCQVCGTKFRFGFNLSSGPGRIGRFLRKIAYVGFLPCLLLGFVLPGIFPGLYRGFNESHAWWLFFGIMFLPPMLLGGLSAMMPASRHLECMKCGWNRDYNPLPLPKIDS